MKKEKKAAESVEIKDIGTHKYQNLGMSTGMCFGMCLGMSFGSLVYDNIALACALVCALACVSEWQLERKRISR